MVELEFKKAILDCLGYAPNEIISGKRQRFATSEGAGDTAGWCELFSDMRGGVFGCWRTGISEHWKADSIAPLSRAERQEYAAKVEESKRIRDAEMHETWVKNASRNQALWNQCKPIAKGDAVHRYLTSRALGSAMLRPEVLRIHSSLKYFYGDQCLGSFPCMVGAITSPSGELVALHRTYLTSKGMKADVPTVKKLTPASNTLNGCSIKLFEPKQGILGIAEGIETALAAMLGANLATVTAYSAGAIASFQPPKGIRHLVIFADHDEAGKNAADKLRSKALALGIGCKVMTPTGSGKDWADVWASSQEVAA
jgi:putative DNA primase/helicase